MFDMSYEDEEIVEFISNETGYDKNTIETILDAEMKYLQMIDEE